MAAQSVGTLQTASLVFNSAILTVNGLQIGNVSNVVLNNAWTKKEFFTLNSVIKKALRRASLQQAMSCDVEGGMYRALYALFFSASSTSTDTTYTVNDGQQTTATVLLTAYENDDTSKYYQVTLTGALMVNHNDTFQAQEFEKVKVDFDCTQMSMLVSSTVSN